ncbi:Uncharacterized protein OBRU01_17630 [Operophtera brumata]|uniref:Uncharacterized protein n=1 Tax=Operophtera brumata TaxID=104452 RepID=A0A0L7L0U3_OPEBR|nr:Uncharacterized protein OBRU01_17630 [Operophtera brumata]
MYGKFYNGDSYIVLKRRSLLRPKFYCNHRNIASIVTTWTVSLDDTLGGRAVHHREVQGHESSIFLGYFKPAIRYMEGGNDSGFNEVAADASSLTADHCFILEVEHDIFVLMPEGAKATQRRKIISLTTKAKQSVRDHLVKTQSQ